MKTHNFLIIASLLIAYTLEIFFSIIPCALCMIERYMLVCSLIAACLYCKKTTIIIDVCLIMVFSYHIYIENQIHLICSNEITSFFNYLNLDFIGTYFSKFPSCTDAKYFFGPLTLSEYGLIFSICLWYTNFANYDIVLIKFFNKSSS